MTHLRDQVRRFYNDYHRRRMRNPQGYQLRKYWSFFHGDVLEIGAGRWLWQGSEKAAYTVAEISDVALESAAQAGVSGVLADGSRLPFSNCTFLTVACHDVLEHVVSPAELIREMCRVSKSYILIAGPNFVGSKIPGEPGADLFTNIALFLRGDGKGCVHLEDPHLVFDHSWAPDADALNAANASWVVKTMSNFGFHIIHLETWGKAVRGFDRLPVLKYLGPFMIVIGERLPS